MGRRVAGGADEAVSPTEFDAIAKSGTGRSTQTVAPAHKTRKQGLVAETPWAKNIIHTGDGYHLNRGWVPP